jgi:hypothetical protein
VTCCPFSIELNRLISSYYANGVNYTGNKER